MYAWRPAAGHEQAVALDPFARGFARVDPAEVYGSDAEAAEGSGHGGGRHNDDTGSPREKMRIAGFRAKVSDRRDRDAGGVQVERSPVGGIVGGRDDHAATGFHAVALEEDAGRVRQHDS